MKRSMCLTMILLFCFTAAYSYETSTHQKLSAQAALLSKIYTDPSLFSDLGLTPVSSALFSRTDINGLRVEDVDAQTIVAAGATVEDYVEPWCDTLHAGYDGQMRVYNHFFDPQNNRALTVSGLQIGRKSPDWALEDIGEIQTTTGGPCANGGRDQIYSYRNAQDHLYNSLVMNTPTQRMQEVSLTMQTLGNVIHHIQDMAQPQHVRNDAHSPKNSLDKQWYENYTQTYLDGRLSVSPDGLQIRDSSNSAPVTYPYPIPSFATARQYWYTVGATTPTYVGMAEFTSRVSGNYAAYLLMEFDRGLNAAG